MSTPEALYRQVKSGKVKLEQLNDEGKNALRSYMENKDAAKQYGTNEQRTGSAVARQSAESQQKTRQESFNNTVYGGTNKLLPKPKKLETVKKKEPVNAVTKVKEQTENLNRMSVATTKKQKQEQGYRSLADRQKEYEIPVVGPVLRQLDQLAETTKPFADVMQTLYTPGGGIANVAGFTKGVGEGIAKILPKIGRGKGLIARGTTKAIEEATVGAPLGVSNVLARDPQASGEQIAEGAAYGVGGGVVAGPLAPIIGDTVQALKQRGLRKEIGEFVGRMDAPRTDPAHPSGRIVQEAPSSNITARGDEAAGNIKRWEGIQTQFDKAVDDQFQLLKKQMDERGGVVQGDLIRDPTTGEVTDRVGRVSNNPQWYRDFFAQNGRKPSQKELRVLASEQVKKGYADDSGQIPPWKPADIEDIDGELASIRGMMDSSTDPAERAALNQVAATLETSRAQIKQQLPEGVKGRVAPRSLPEMSDNFLKPLNHYADTLYRETSANEVLEYLPGSNTFADTTRDVVYLANNKDLALGQGLNKGVMVEFDPSGMRGQVNTSKPTWEMTYKNGDAEFVAKLNSQDKYRNAVKSITVAADAQMDKATKMRLKRVLSDWEKQVNPDGSTTFFVPGKSSIPEGVQGRIAPGVQAKATPPVPASSAAGTATPTPPSSGQASAAGVANQPPSSLANPKKTISRRQLTSSIKKNLGLVIRTGRTGPGENVLGVYKVKPEVIRTSKSQDYDTMAHEIGHHLTKKHRLLDPQFERELVDMMDQMGEHPYKQYKRHEWFDEGVAEYMRVFLQDPQRAKQLAPKFSSFLDQKLPKEVKSGIRKVQKDISIWLNQGDAMRFRGKITEGSRADKGTISQRAEKVYGSMVDKLTHLDTVEKDINALAGGDRELSDASQSLYKRARLTAGAPKKAKWIVSEVDKIFKPLEKNKIPIRDFRDYALALHADDLEHLGYESGFTRSEINQVIRDYDSPIMRQVQSDLVTLQNKVLDMAVNEGQLLTPEAAAAMKKKYPNYIPMFRDLDEDMVSGLISGKGFADLNSPIKTRKGSSHDVRDPIENVVRNVFTIIDHIEKNKVGLELSKLAKVDGAGKWIERLDGAQSVKPEIIVTVWEKGQKVQYQLEPELYRAIKQMDEDSSSAVIKMLSIPTQILRGGATLAPEFILRNPIRDQFQAYVVSEFGYNPIIDLPHGMFRVLKGKLWKNGDKHYDQWIREGGGYGNTHSVDRNYLREQIAQLKDERNPWVRRTVAIADPRQWLRLLQAMSEFTEESTKVGEFARGIRKGATPAEAAFQSRDLMDFARIGNSIKQANRITAFLNANIQGKDRMVRAFIKHPARTTIRAVAGVTMPTIGFYLYNKHNSNEVQKETLREAPQWMRETFFLVSVPGTDVVARIPKPFDLAPVFSNLPENIMRWMDDNDPQALGEFSKSQAIQMLNIPYMLTALTPALENMTNYDFFTRGPVVPRRDQDMLPEDQYGNNTSLLAREAGGILNYSPYKIDNAISGYGASMGRHITSGIDAIMDLTGMSSRPPAAAKHFSEQPVVNAFTVNNSGGGKSLDDFYKELDAITERYNSLKKNEGTDKALESEYKSLNKTSREISKLSTERRETQASYRLSPNEKRNYLDELDDHIKKLAREGLAAAK